MWMLSIGRDRFIRQAYHFLGTTTSRKKRRPRGWYDRKTRNCLLHAMAQKWHEVKIRNEDASQKWLLEIRTNSTLNIDTRVGSPRVR